MSTLAQQFITFITNLSDNTTILSFMENYLIQEVGNKIPGVQLVSGFLSSNNWQQIVTMIVSSDYGQTVVTDFMNTLNDIKSHFTLSFFEGSTPSQKLVFIVYILQKIASLEQAVQNFESSHQAIIQFLQDHGLSPELTFLNNFCNVVSQGNIQIAIDFITQFGNLLDEVQTSCANCKGCSGGKCIIL